MERCNENRGELLAVLAPQTLLGAYILARNEPHGYAYKTGIDARAKGIK